LAKGETQKRRGAAWIGAAGGWCVAAKKIWATAACTGIAEWIATQIWQRSPAFSVEWVWATCTVEVNASNSTHAIASPRIHGVARGPDRVLDALCPMR